MYCTEKYYCTKEKEIDRGLWFVKCIGTDDCELWRVDTLQNTEGCGREISCTLCSLWTISDVHGWADQQRMPYFGKNVAESWRSVRNRSSVSVFCVDHWWRASKSIVSNGKTYKNIKWWVEKLKRRAKNFF